MILDEIATAFREGKLPNKKIRDAFLLALSNCDKPSKSAMAKVFSPKMPKGTRVLEPKHKPKMRETCLWMIASELLRSRDITVEQAIQHTKSDHDKAKQNIGLNQLQRWWDQGYEIENADKATSEELNLWQFVRRAKNRYKKTEWKRQPMEFVTTADGRRLLKLRSVRLIPVKKKIST